MEDTGQSQPRYDSLPHGRIESAVQERLVPRLRALPDFDLAMMLCEVHDHGLDSMAELLGLAEEALAED